MDFFFFSLSRKPHGVFSNLEILGVNCMEGLFGDMGSLAGEIVSSQWDDVFHSRESS